MRRVASPFVSALLVAVSLAALSAAQDAVFRTAVELVTVDAFVVGRDGAPVASLGPDDFVLEVDGRPRRVLTAQFVAQTAPAERRAAPADQHFTSNEHADAGRFVVVAVDEAHIRRLEGRAALSGAAGFIDMLDPLDQVAVTGLSRVGTVEFTRDRIALKRRLEGLVGHTDPVFLQFNIGLSEAIEVADGSRSRLADLVIRECGGSLATFANPARAADDPGGSRDACPEQVEQEARAVSQHARTQARISLSALEALIDALKAIDGPKTVVLLSEGMAIDPRLVDLAELASHAKDARVTIHALVMETPTFEASHDRISPTFVRDMQVRADGVARLAGAARGAVFRLVGSDPRPFQRIVRELSGYYLLAFESVEADRDGRVHRIKVSLKRNQGDVRAREAFRLPPAVPSARARELQIVNLLRESRPSTELPVRVATYTYVEPDSSKLRIVVSTEADAATGAAMDMLFGFVLIDARGVIAASGAQRTPASRHAFSTVVPPGAYALRVAGIDPLGRHGLVERTFAAAVETSGGLRVSDLILARVGVRPESPLEPIVDRVVEPQLTAYLELHATDVLPLREARVVFEIASDATSAAQVTVRAEVSRRDARWAIARAEVPLESLAAGRFVARARVFDGEREVVRVTRPFAVVRP